MRSTDGASVRVVSRRSSKMPRIRSRSRRPESASRSKASLHRLQRKLRIAVVRHRDHERSAGRQEDHRKDHARTRTPHPLVVRRDQRRPGWGNVSGKITGARSSTTQTSRTSRSCCRATSIQSEGKNAYEHDYNGVLVTLAGNVFAPTVRTTGRSPTQARSDRRLPMQVTALASATCRTVMSGSDSRVSRSRQFAPNASNREAVQADEDRRQHAHADVAISSASLSLDDVGTPYGTSRTSITHRAEGRSDDLRGPSRFRVPAGDEDRHRRRGLHLGGQRQRIPFRRHRQGHGGGIVRHRHRSALRPRGRTELLDGEGVARAADDDSVRFDGLRLQRDSRRTRTQRSDLRVRHGEHRDVVTTSPATTPLRRHRPRHTRRVHVYCRER